MLHLSEITRAHPAPLVPDRFNLAAHVLQDSAARLPDKIALQILKLSGAERWSYARLIGAVQGVASGLSAMGLEPQARVLLRLGNQVEFALTYLGAIAAGFVPVVTSAQLTQAEITAMAELVSPALVVAAEGIALPDHPARVIRDQDIRAMEALPPLPFDLGDPDRLAYVVFTSGSAGRPRAVAHAHRAILAREMMHADWEGLGEGDRLLHAGALNWTYTLGTGLLDPWRKGATALIPAEGLGVAQLPLLMKRFDATIFAAAPGVYRQLLRLALPALPRLRHGLSAGEKLADDTRAAWVAATGTPLCEALGMSECSTFVSLPPDAPACPEGAVGYAQTGRHIAALGDDLQPVACGTAGQLAVRADDAGLMLGYFDASDPAGPRYDLPLQAGWFLSGDMVTIAEDGAVTYLGRNDDQMNAGGFRVSPLEVEKAFVDFAGLTGCGVVEYPLEEGKSVIACFYTADTPLDEAALQAHAESRLARYKQPRIYRHIAALPLGANAKLNRRMLRQERL